MGYFDAGLGSAELMLLSGFSVNAGFIRCLVGSKGPLTFTVEISVPILLVAFAADSVFIR
jgi:hypothetical protein